MDKIKTIIEQEHSLSWGVITSYILYVLSIPSRENILQFSTNLILLFVQIATDMLSRPIAKQQKGSFIGYSSVGNPLYRF